MLMQFLEKPFSFLIIYLFDRNFIKYEFFMIFLEDAYEN